ncbi:MAG: PTS sugar transporter subunit IIA [Enterococcaceae bacterium]|jgi:PTS system mannitol-specific IIA component/PTS system ascorbate-specific IIA component|nr:PTS sugar transporter subunit IIA [Enterococcaceae bacterium]MCI1919315.1 PTS sugar transporter subunit IIA [Enterococcaceae bacterium]
MQLQNITEQDIQVGIKAKDWEEAIRKSAAPLVMRGSIEETYVESIIDSVKRNGPYFVLTKHVALAHARPETGVNNLDLNFTILENPVSFGHKELDPIKMIITLAATDASSHLEVIADLTDILIDEKLLEKIFSAKTTNEVYLLLSGKG